MKIDNKHLLPEPWYNYPVLQKGQFESIELLKKPSYYIGSTIRIGQQDGIWVLGYSFLSGSCNPGRKWGEFNSKEDAVNYFIDTNIKKLYQLKTQKESDYNITLPQINEMIESMNALRNNQLSLF